MDEVLAEKSRKSSTGWTLLDQLMQPPSRPVVELKGLLLGKGEVTYEQADLVRRTAEQLSPVLAGLLKERKP